MMPQNDNALTNVPVVTDVAVVVTVLSVLTVGVVTVVGVVVLSVTQHTMLYVVQAQLLLREKHSNQIWESQISYSSY